MEHLLSITLCLSTSDLPSNSSDTMRILAEALSLLDFVFTILQLNLHSIL